MKPTILLVSVLILISAALFGCRRAAVPPPRPPPPDFTTLKRDLLELDQSLVLSRRTGIVQPDRYIAAVQQLERDYRLQRDKPTGRAQQGVEAAIRAANLLGQAGAHYVAAYRRPDDYPNGEADRRWAILDAAYLDLHPSTDQDAIDLAVQQLEAAEHPVSQK